MSNYTKTTDFAAKDALLTGNPSKIVKGTEIDDEFDAIATAVATKADSASPTFTGTVTLPATVAMASLTASRALVTNGSSQFAVSAVTGTELGYLSGVTSAVQTQLDAKAPLASPTFTGTATAAALTATGTVTFSGLTATTVPYLNASKQFASSAVTPTELGYLSGVTSAIQTQINAKYGSGSNVSLGTVSCGAITGTTGNFSGALTATDFTISSDLRKKSDIFAIKGALDMVSKLDGVHFTYKDTHKKSVGFIAQEVEAVLPELVSRDEEGFLSVSYGQMTAVLVEAVKELRAEVHALKGAR